MPARRGNIVSATSVHSFPQPLRHGQVSTPGTCQRRRPLSWTYLKSKLGGDGVKEEERSSPRPARRRE